MKKFLWLPFIFTILFAEVVIGQNKNPLDEVKALSKRKFSWMINGQLDSLESLLDNDVRYVHSNGWIQTKQDIIGDFKTKKLVLKNVTIESDSIRQFNSTAIVIGKGKFEGSINNTNFILDLIYTEVYIINNRRWQLVSRHANRLN